MRRILFLTGVILLAGCAGRVIQFEQYSIAMDQAVSADSSIYLGDEEKFHGVMRLGPILEQEKAAVKSVKIIQNYGKYFLSADGFKNVWMIEPESDGLTGRYGAIDVTPGDTTDVLKDISFSRYGSKENTCIKLRYDSKEIFIDRKGKLNEKCN
jgi:hypothetical protein